MAFERIIYVLSQEHEEELRARTRSGEARRLNRIEELLAGEIIEAPELSYPFSSIHVGLVGTGPAASVVIRRLATTLGMHLLAIRPNSEITWAWLNSKQEWPTAEIAGHLPSPLQDGVRIAVGEPGGELLGWRRSHRQAQAALSVAAADRTVIRYADVPLLASTARDELLCVSLREMYLLPLTRERDGGKVLTETLRAYYAAGRNRASAAAALGYSRQTVAQRLRKTEELLGQPIDACADALHMALQLEELGHIEP